MHHHRGSAGAAVEGRSMMRLTFTISFLSVLMAGGAGLADAELPENARIPVSDMPSAVSRLVVQSCGAEAADRSQWNAYKMPLKPAGAVFFVQCRFPASNDVHTVVMQRPDGKARLGRFSDGQSEVFNVRWDESSQIITDISQSGSGCVHLRKWQWNRNRFVLAGKKTIDCASQ